MDGNWAKYGMLTLLLGVLIGCRTTQPSVKPVEQPEVLNRPPQEARFENPGMPKEAFNREDSRRWKDLGAEGNAVMPARGSFGGPGGGAMR